MKTHKVDKGGDGKSWTEYDQGVSHILAYRGKEIGKEPENRTRITYRNEEEDDSGGRKEAEAENTGGTTRTRRE